MIVEFVIRGLNHQFEETNYRKPYRLLSQDARNKRENELAFTILYGVINTTLYKADGFQYLHMNKEQIGIDLAFFLISSK